MGSIVYPSPLMESITIFTSIALFFFFFFFFLPHLTKLLFTNKNKSLPPSPPSLPIIGHLHHLKKPLHRSLARLSARHGPILLLRFGTRPVLVVSSADIAEECFTANDVAFANRIHLPTFRLISYDFANIANANYGPGWRDMRRVAVAQVLSGHRLGFFHDVRAEEARALARILFRDTAAGGEFARVDLRPRLFGLAINVVMRMTVGKRYYGEDGGDVEALRFKEMTREILSFAGVSNMGDFLPAAIAWFARLRVKRRLARVHSYRDRFFQAILEERRRQRMEEKKVTDGTLVDAILSMQQEQPEQYNDHFIKSIIASLLIAGTDTTSNTMEWAMSLLLNNPEKLEKSREEIEEQVGHSRILLESDLPNLPYLHCIINETLRMYPSGPLLVPHQSWNDCMVGGYEIPRGTILLVNAYMIQRDPKIWAEPTKFLPERHRDMKPQGCNMLPFGMGRRRCPGEGLAMKEVGLVLGTLIQCFEWKRIGNVEVDMKEGSGQSMARAHPLQALCRPRQSLMPVLTHL